MADITQLMHGANQGDRGASDRLFELVYNDLRRQAAGVRRAWNPDDPVNTTVLANEACLAFLKKFPEIPADADRGFFFFAAARAMRTILRDEWKKRIAQRRGGGKDHYEIKDDDAAVGKANIDPIELDEAMDRLETINKKWFDVALLRLYAGRSSDETAKILGVGLSTAKEHWKEAQGWLRRELAG